MSPSVQALSPAPIAVEEQVLQDLRSRLRATIWPEDDGNDDGRYGVPRTLLQELAQYWAEEYDWRAAERAMNAYEHYLVDVSGTRVHFMRKPGAGPDPTPLILSHGWPWTFWHWSKVVDRLADPAAFGGDPADAFEVIVPSLPGFGYSTPTRPDMSFWKIADVWHELMTQTLGHARRRLLEIDRRFAVHLAAHVLAPNLLTHATIYWTGNAIASSIRTYANNNRYPWAPSHDRTPVIEAPTGITFVDYENPPGVNSPEERIESFLASDRAAWYNHVNIAAHPHGGHFIPWEIPEQWTTDLVRTFKQTR